MSMSTPKPATQAYDGSCTQCVDVHSDATTARHSNNDNNNNNNNDNNNAKNNGNDNGVNSDGVDNNSNNSSTNASDSRHGKSISDDNNSGNNHISNSHSDNDAHGGTAMGENATEKAAEDAKVDHVMIVDDSQLNLLLLTSLVTRVYRNNNRPEPRIYTFQEPSDALHAWVTTPVYSVMIVDKHIPSMEGAEFLRRWRLTCDPVHVKQCITIGFTGDAGGWNAEDGAYALRSRGGVLDRVLAKGSSLNALSEAIMEIRRTDGDH